jgi:threonine 3-dehydrogenase
MMKSEDERPILITGGTGFIGSYLALTFLKQDQDVVVFDRNPDERRITQFKEYQQLDQIHKNRLTFVQGDLTLLAHVLALFDTHEPRAVFHLGALLAGGTEANPTMGFQIDLVGTWNVLEAARLYCQHNRIPPVKFLFPSSIASFGEFIAPGQKVPNEAPQIPTMYGVAKVSSERLGEYYHRKGWVNFRAVRFPAIFGAARGPGGVTAYSSLMIQEPLRGNEYEVYVTPESRLDIIYVKDAVHALTTLYSVDETNQKLSRRVYNIAGIRIGEQAPKASDIEAAIRHVLPDAKVKYTKDPDPAIIATLNSFGVLDDTLAAKDWKWKGSFLDLNGAVKDFAQVLADSPKRILSLSLFG